MKNSKTIYWLSAAMLACGVMSYPAHAAVQLLSFQANPITPGLPEFSFVGEPGDPQSFVAAAGATGNTGGTPPPGLEIDTPFPVNEGSIPDETTDATGSHFIDVSLTISGLNATTAYELLNPLVNLGVQSLSDGGTFTLTAPGGAVLLQGTFNSNSITAPLNSSSLGFQSQTATYQSGAILDALGGNPLTGSASISMTTLGGPVVVNQTGPAVGFLDQAPATFDPYDANATGVFDVTAVPEPASISLLLLGGVMGLRRRRR